MDFLKDSSIKSSQVSIEITERVYVKNFAKLSSDLNHFKSLGVKISIDDIGEGYKCPAFLQDRIPGPQPPFIDDGTNIEYRIMRGLKYFKQVGLVGPTGVGKTHIVYRIASECKLPLFEVNCALGTSTYELIGKYVGLGKENWVDGTIVMWCRYGGILYLDEANMMRADVYLNATP
jgi:nitric oxide reductase NorQ protein